MPVLTTDTALTAPADPGSVRDIAIGVLMAGIPFLAGRPVMAAGSMMRSKSAVLMYPEASAASRSVVPSSLTLCAMAEALS